MNARLEVALLASLQEDVHAFLVRRDHVQFAVQVDVGDFELSARPAVVIEHLRRPNRPSFFAG